MVFCDFKRYYYWRKLYLCLKENGAKLYQPVAVLSTIVGNVLTKVAKKLPKTPGHEVAGALSVISGCIVFFIGLVRLGWIVEFISLTAIAAYMTGSAVNIAVSQVPGLMGITGFSNRDATYKVVINILKHLGRTKLDAAMGLTALTMLYLIRAVCSYSAKRFPQSQRRHVGRRRQERYQEPHGREPDRPFPDREGGRHPGLYLAALLLPPRPSVALRGGA